MKVLSLTTALICGSITSYAADTAVTTNTNNWDTGLRISTLGAGAELGYKLNDNFRIRLVGQGFKYSTDYTDTDLTYDGDLDLLTIGPMLDWHPWGGSFKLSGGLFYNGNEVSMTAKPTSDVKIGDNTYSPSDIGTVDMKVDFNSVAPYLGFGWGNAFKGSNWTFNFEMGAMYQGEGDLSYSTNGAAVNNAAFQADIAKEQDELQDEINKYKFYPVITLGLTYSF